MFDCLIPIGQTCNVSFLLQNAKIKKHTSLFEWFTSPSLIDITSVLIKVGNNTDNDIIKTKTNSNHVFIEDKIHSSHYKYESFLNVYHRRRNRLINLIKSRKKILFCRVEVNASEYSKKDIDDFIKAILFMNANLEDIKLLLITPKMELDHPSLIKVIYNHSSDPYCKSKEINNLFVNTLHQIGYDVKDQTDICFTDLSDL